MTLNDRAGWVAVGLTTRAEEFRIRPQAVAGARVIDCGVAVPGGLHAGLELARACLADLADVSITPPALDGLPYPGVQVTTDHPIRACLQSQYAGWQIAVGKYFAMGSGPMRAKSGGEKLYDDIGGREDAPVAVGVLESRKLPPDDVVNYLAEK